MRSDKPSPCTELLGDPARAERRVADAFDAVAEFTAYRKLLWGVAQLSPEARAACPGLGATIADRAFDAEVSGRVLIKHALDSLNELRDGGGLYETLGTVAQGLSAEGTSSVIEKLRRDAASGGDHLGEQAAGLLDEAAKAIEAIGLGFSSQKGALLVHRKNGPQGEDQFRLATTRQLGQAGRVSSAEFFGGRNGAFATSPALYAPKDCHHSPLRIKDAVADVDFYAAAVGGLATSKALLYQHARRVSELGPRGLRGEDPVTAILIAIAVVGAALVVIGIATNNPALAVFGAILIVGAALVAFGGFTLILAIVA
jgi:hypothetical protein